MNKFFKKKRNETYRSSEAITEDKKTGNKFLLPRLNRN